MNNEYPLKLSIIVPVYNVEKYLERCVNSLLHQDIDKSEYEIILVNDGSTDNSGDIAKQYADFFIFLDFFLQLIKKFTIFAMILLIN